MAEETPAPSQPGGHEAAQHPPAGESSSSYTLGLGNNVTLTIQDKVLLIQGTTDEHVEPTDHTSQPLGA